MNKQLIIERKEIILNDSLTRMVISGWGEEAYDNTIVEKISYLSDGFKVKGFIARPKDSSRKYPCIIWNRGGAGNRGAIDEFTARGIYGQLASWGYCVFASQYRGNAGGEGKEELGGIDVNDVLNLIPLAEEISVADKTKWAIEGWSRGGMMTYLALRKNSNFKCAVLVGAISDLEQDSTEMKKYYKEFVGNENVEAELKKRSAIHFTNELPQIPYLILHGGNDQIISPFQSIEISKKFLDLKIDHRLVIFENGDHYLKSHKKEVDEMRKMWYRKYHI